MTAPSGRIRLDRGGIPCAPALALVLVHRLIASLQPGFQVRVRSDLRHGGGRTEPEPLRSRFDAVVQKAGEAYEYKILKTAKAGGESFIASTRAWPISRTTPRPA